MNNSVSKDRMGAFSDGVIAVAATVLVLNLSVSAETSLSWEMANHWLRVIISWLVSFALIALVWLENHTLLRHARELSMPLAILTMLQLAAVSLIPFVSDLVIDFPFNLAVSLAFSAVMLANGLIGIWMGYVLARSSHLHTFEHSGAFLRKRARSQVAICLIVAATAVGTALLHTPFIGAILWGLSPALVALTLRSQP